MARLSRYCVHDQSVHVIRRGNNRGPMFATFATEDDYQFYFDCLMTAAEAQSLAIHAYVLMANHVHWLATPNRGQPSQGNAIHWMSLCPIFPLQLRADGHSVGGALQGHSDQ